ncbi:MAG: stage II sporulation protein R [Clostridia bacterium]|nr:stage II sporulation protein R [Clostridia bacterium]
MKKLCITLVSLAIILLAGLGVSINSNQVKTEYLRIHIRANSNSDDDQAVKYKIKTAVIEYLTPFISECNTKQKAKQVFLEQELNVEKVANKVLLESGFNYQSKVQIREEYFPTRVYDGITLDAGVYDAVIIELGNAQGQNWWCVVYPPLCFVNVGTKYEYKSKILEIVNDFIKREGQ